MNRLRDILNYQLIHYGTIKIDFIQIVALAIVVVSIKLILWLSKRALNKYLNHESYNKGRRDAFFQITKYFLYVVGLVISLDIIGVQITILLAGSAALLVGLGLGIQQIFNDFVSGIILLFEGTVTLGDIVEIDGLVGKVKQIDLRTSKIEARDSKVIIVPNSKLVSDNVINWSHNRRPTRFKIMVGVQYGSDTRLVSRLIQEAALEHISIVKEPAPFARFNDFGDSALIFELLFFTKEMFIIETIKSDIRYVIDDKFRENGIVIPFPQRDLHIIGNPKSPKEE